MALHHDVCHITGTEKHATDFLFQRGITKISMLCPGCSTNMTLVACSASKSPDLLIWCCPLCRKFKNIQADSVLAGQKPSLPTFMMLVST